MLVREIVERFKKKRPISLMARMALLGTGRKTSTFSGGEGPQWGRGMRCERRESGLGAGLDPAELV